ncbi:MAG: hypothetical protein HC836_10255 [Richelia sp. RM2_1_2]|nr:hypothetical protein [Richelia sp. SM2_1_7]NJM21162.1 hypothetical protein [Richelia sp. SM1_7_0]NJN08035.1 hypothetical protein [Richelia sp. RM1_1_1]NJO27805.1 hypothetical protein [Richelia sp. SL_2_1]NJO58707.1 hypothetical protein [Richelia sp. RM2_1_2]
MLRLLLAERGESFATLGDSDSAVLAATFVGSDEKLLLVLHLTEGELIKN